MNLINEAQTTFWGIRCNWAHLAHSVHMPTRLGLVFCTYSNELLGSMKSRKFLDCQQLLASEDKLCSMQFVITVIALLRWFWYSVLDIQDHLLPVDLKLQSYLSNIKSDIFIILFFIFLQSKFWICVIRLLKNKLTAVYSPKTTYTFLNAKKGQWFRLGIIIM